MPFFQYHAIDRVHFDRPAAEAILEEASIRNARRVFVVASRTLNRTTDAVRGCIKPLGSRVVGIFDECVPLIPRETAVALADRLREARADLVVTIGGGQVIDTVKVALVCLAQNVKTADDLDEWTWRPGPDGAVIRPNLNPIPCRQIVIPTTMSASEYHDFGGSTDRKLGRKTGFGHPHIAAAAVVLDPAISLHTPEELWFSTGMRAIDHAVAHISADNAVALTDATCTEAIVRLRTNLPKSKSSPKALAPRMQCQLGSWLSAFGKGRVSFGVCHGIGNLLHEMTGVAHSMTTCVLLPTCLEWNRPILGEKYLRIARAFDTEGDASAAIRNLITSLGLPTRLRDVGVSADAFKSVAARAVGHPMVLTNPCPVSVDDVIEILSKAW
jgi:maleylacetate reductase